MTAAIEISVREGYERWAPSYPHLPGNPLMRAEQQLMLHHWPAVAGRRALDLACGSGRYTRLLGEGSPAEVVAVDSSPGMLRRVSGAGRVCASLSRLRPSPPVRSMSSSWRALPSATSLISGPGCAKSRV